MQRESTKADSDLQKRFIAANARPLSTEALASAS
jgi:hypothetical protein